MADHDRMNDLEAEHEGFILHGAVVYSRDAKTLEAADDAYLICVDGLSKGVFSGIPEEYAGLPVHDLWDKLILPGFVDLHVHAPQYQFRSLGTDMELLEWLDTYVFREEASYSDLEYAERAYDLFVEDLYTGPTTRACVFATTDPDATLGLMDMLEETGLKTFVGKVNMDRNAPDYYVEDTEDSLAETYAFLDAVCESGYENTQPILTPRFTPACTRKLMDGLGRIAAERHLPVQSHLSENRREIEWVSELEKDAAFYGETYDRSGLFGSNGKCIMAHCVWSTEDEIALLKKRGVFIAHCPDSNLNLSSGIAPAKRYLEEGMRIGLGSDVAAGSTTSMFAAVRSAIQSSKARWRMFDESVKPLTFPEAFYMATKGGGAFFGQVGSFEEGYEFDALIIDDEPLSSMLDASGRIHAAERAERVMYLADDRHIAGKYVAGRQLF